MYVGKDGERAYKDPDWQSKEIAKLTDRIATLEAKNERLREALKDIDETVANWGWGWDGDCGIGLSIDLKVEEALKEKGE